MWLVDSYKIHGTAAAIIAIGVLVPSSVIALCVLVCVGCCCYWKRKRTSTTSTFGTTTATIASRIANAVRFQSRARTTTNTTQADTGPAHSFSLQPGQLPQNLRSSQPGAPYPTEENSFQYPTACSSTTSCSCWTSSPCSLLVWFPGPISSLLVWCPGPISSTSPNH